MKKKKKDILQKDRERIYNCKVFVVFFFKGNASKEREVKGL